MLELGDGNEMQIGMFCGWGNDREVRRRAELTGAFSDLQRVRNWNPR